MTESSPSESQSKSIDQSASKPIDPSKMSRFWKFTRMVCRPIMTLVFELRVYGRHHVPRKGGVLPGLRYAHLRK